MNLKERREALEKRLRDLALAAKANGDRFTDEQLAEVNTNLAELEGVKSKIVQAEKSQSIMDRITDLHRDRHPEEYEGDQAKGNQVLSFRGIARQIKANMAERGGFNIKALVSVGSQVTETQTLTSPVAMQKPATGLFDIFPVKVLDAGDEYSYLTQVTRTNNAAPVAAGAVKPTSVYTLERVTRRLEVIAHLSEPIPEYWLGDEPALNQFLIGEMAFGLQMAAEDQFLNGNGTSPNLLGLLNVPGTQVQAFNTSQVRTARSAITKVEALGYVASGFMLNPLDWEAIETSEDADDRFLMTPNGAPVDRAARRLWGVPVAVTTQIAQGAGVLVSDGAAQVVTDGQTNMQWGRQNDDFSRNQVRARFEGRFGLETLRPSGVVEIDLSA